MQENATRPATHLFLLAILMLFSTTGFSETATSEPILKSSEGMEQMAGIKAHSKKTGLFKTFRMVKELRKDFKKKDGTNDKPSKMAWAALILFCSGIALNILTGPLGIVFLAGLASLAVLASIILSFIVVFSDENRKSKAIAKTILIISGIALILTVIMIIALINAFGG
jgi:hypothetical protein